jgi:DNA-binding MarR family transcriptional regulator
LPDFIHTAVKEIDDQLRTLKDEASRLEAARAALTGTTRRRGRATSNGTRRTPARPASRRNGRSAAPRSRGGNTRAAQALELVRETPGITIPEIAKAMKIEPNYLYRVLPRLASDGQVKREGQGWHPATASTSTRPETVRSTPARKRTRAAKPKSTASATRTARNRRGDQSTTSATNGRRTHGATKASVLAALAGGEAMTAGQVATKAGLARPTVSTTLSKMAKTGEVQKADRGYRLPSAA